MKVLLVHTRYQLKGGEDTVVQNELDLLVSSGIETKLLEFSNTGNAALKLVQLPFNLPAYFTTLKTIRRFRPDVIHIHNLHFSGSASVLYAVRRCRVPAVLTLHNYRLLCPSATLFNRGKFFLDSLTNTFSWKAVREGIYLNSRLLTFWVSLAAFLHQKLRTWDIPVRYIALGGYTTELFSLSTLNSVVPKITVKPNFCYPAPLRNEGVASGYLYIGRLSEEKGISVLLEAFSLNGLKLTIAGAGPLEAKVKDYCRKYDNMRFAGILEKRQVQELLAASTALVFPSLWYETFGMVIIEAFAAGTPVIASDLGQMKELVEAGVNGLRFEAGNVLDLNNKIESFEKLSPVGRQLFSQGARITYEEKYTPAKNASLLLQIYQDAIGSMPVKGQ